MELGKTQAQIAKLAGIAPSTYGNVESQNHVVISGHKVHVLARAFGLDQAGANALHAAWKQLPVSEYSEKRKEQWAKKNAQRSKVKRFDRLLDVTAGIVALLIASVDDPGTLCNCSFDGSTVCELCDALRELGLNGWTTSEQVMKELAALQEKLGDTGNGADGKA